MSGMIEAKVTPPGGTPPGRPVYIPARQKGFLPTSWYIIQLVGRGSFRRAGIYTSSLGGKSVGPKQEQEEAEEELQYNTIINSILPNSVRVLAWLPVHHDFDTRFSCQARHYKYFFSLYKSPQAPGLDIEAMKWAAHRLIGEHDFHNFFKIDPSKQLTHFRRKILSAEIKPVLNPHHLLQKQPSGSSGSEKDLQPQIYPDALSPETLSEGTPSDKLDYELV
ncbi:tRNA pseudouridine synthase 3 [Puccinia graminis f. sp. tritici]|uniref:tRNA pseudouridine synthase 3 n=1 Tax=Puccinia graminis f. sp. tritici TaxID=56615 RepID=A0A5B0S8J8_PUCGR|nr:tRNA pseudouridine synthase 3 [Puccinia graminis f. sp. tritici]